MTAQELKNSILQLAVQGKLVPQCKDDEPASELLKRIRAVKEKTVKKEKPLPAISEEEIPFDIPENWEWVRLGILGILKSGYAFKSTEYIDKGIQVVRISDLGDDCILSRSPVFYEESKDLQQYLITQDSFLICMTGSIGKMAWVKDAEKRYLNQRVGMFELFDKINKEYVWIFLHSAYVVSKLVGTKTSLNGNIKNSDINELLIPVPPLAEQRRIVEKIEELMPLIEEYGKADEQLDKLNAEFPDKLRKSILQQAVQGKLTERNPADEPASELLKRIKAEKEALIKSGKIKKEKPLPAITDDEKPFDIPDTWEWVRLSDVAEVARGKSKHRPRNDKILYENGKIPLIQTGDVARADGEITDCKTFYNDVGLAQSKLWTKGTLCLTIAANIADVAILGIDACFPDSVVGINGYYPIDSNKYFMYMLEAYQTILDGKATQSAQKNLNVDTILSVSFPFPPLAEQKRIVKRVEELLALCDKLK